jgi:hypothetical protein
MKIFKYSLWTITTSSIYAHGPYSVKLLTSLDSAGSLIDRSIELYLAFIEGYITTHVPHKATWSSTEAIVHRHKSFLICLRFFISSTFTDYFMRYLYLPHKVTSVVKRSGTTSTYEFPNLPTVFYA